MWILWCWTWQTSYGWWWEWWRLWLTGTWWGLGGFWGWKGWWMGWWGVCCWHDMVHEGWCGREGRCTCWLSHSDAFPMGSSIWLHILKLSYTFLFLYISHIIKLLTILSFHLELQLDVHYIWEDPQIHSTWQLHKFVTHHASSRVSLKIPLSSWRIGHWFQFYFYFYGYFCLFDMLLLKIQDLNMLSLSWLVNSQINELICWMVGSNSIIWVHSTLLGWPGDVLSIECLDDGPIPETSPVADIPRWGLNDTSPTIINISIFNLIPQSVLICHFFSLISLCSLWLRQEYVCNHMSLVSPMLLCIKGVLPPAKWSTSSFPHFLGFYKV